MSGKFSLVQFFNATYVFCSDNMQLPCDTPRCADPLSLKRHRQNVHRIITSSQFLSPPRYSVADCWSVDANIQTKCQAYDTKAAPTASTGQYLEEHTTHPWMMDHPHGDIDLVQVITRSAIAFASPKFQYSVAHWQCFNTTWAETRMAH